MDILSIISLVLISYLSVEVSQLKKMIRDQADSKKADLESALTEASTLLNKGKVAEATQVVDRILKS
jgi:hypothetical protein